MIRQAKRRYLGERKLQRITAVVNRACAPRADAALASETPVRVPFAVDAAVAPVHAALGNYIIDQLHLWQLGYSQAHPRPQ